MEKRENCAHFYQTNVFIDIMKGEYIEGEYIGCFNQKRS